MRTLLGRWQTWAGFGLAAVVLFGVAPAVLSDFRLSLLGKFLCFAIVAVGIGLAWGRGGMLVLGQGVFFGLGGYIMAMHLKVADAQLAGDAVPDFMQIQGVRELPGYWAPFASPLVTVLAILILPAAIAAAALAILLVGQTSLGGSNGLNRFRTFFGFNLNDPVNRQMLYFIAAGVLLVVVAVARQLMQSRYGELLVAVRDGEERVRFLGYDPANIKVVAYTVAALLAVAGRYPAVHRILDRSGDRRPHHPAGSGARRHRRGLGANPVLRTVSVGVDLRPGSAVHRRGRLLPGRPGRARGVPQAAPQEVHRRRAGRGGPRPGSAGRERKGGCPVMTQPSAPVAGGNAGMGTQYLEVRGLTVDFDGFKAVQDVDLTLFQGDLRFLIGPNGAGKTTVIDAITGLVGATGSVNKSGVELLGKKVHQIARLGVGRTFQTASVFEKLTVLADTAAAPLRGAAVDRGGPGDHRSDASGRETGRRAGPRAEAVAGDRHAAGAERRCAAARRTGGRDEHRGARGDRKPVAPHRG
jgi:ABC-type branched-subunit amino acid transport system permease subunit